MMAKNTLITLSSACYNLEYLAVLVPLKIPTLLQDRRWKESNLVDDVFTKKRGGGDIIKNNSSESQIVLEDAVPVPGTS